MEDTRHSSADVLTARCPADQHKDECLTTDMPEPWFDTLRVPQELVLYSTSLHYARLSELCFTRAELRLLLLKSRHPLCLKPHVCDSSFHSGLRDSLGCAPTLQLTNAERPTQNSKLASKSRKTTMPTRPPWPRDHVHDHAHQTTFSQELLGCFCRRNTLLRWASEGPLSNQMREPDAITFSCNRK